MTDPHTQFSPHPKAWLHVALACMYCLSLPPPPPAENLKLAFIPGGRPPDKNLRLAVSPDSNCLRT